jgi:hypothetical protein
MLIFPKHMKKLCLVLLLICAYPAFAQKMLKGIVSDENGTALPGASVFLANTTIGTTADARGGFELSVPQGKYELVISSIGFETYSLEFNASMVVNNFEIKLKPKVKELETVIVTPFEKDGWEKWGSFFTENFLGSPYIANGCSIKNYKTIRFRHFKNPDELVAYAIEPLIIENKNLGYRIRYQMETFSYDFTTHYLVFEGYPFFEEMPGSERQHRKWEERRAEVYEGSIMHFMRALYP